MFVAGHVERTFEGHQEAIMIQHIARTTCAMRLLAVGMDPPTRSRCMKRMTKPTVMTARTMEYTVALLASGDVLHGRDARDDDDEGGGEESHDCADSFDRGSDGAHPDRRGAAVDDGSRRRKTRFPY